MSKFKHKTVTCQREKIDWCWRFSPSSDHRIYRWRSLGRGVWPRSGGSQRWASGCGNRPASSATAACECGSGPPQWWHPPETTMGYRKRWVTNAHCTKYIFCPKVNCIFELWCYSSVVKKPDLCLFISFDVINPKRNTCKAYDQIFAPKMFPTII